MKYYIKHSDTCDCKYVQTYDPELETDGVYNPLAWGSVDSYTTPDGTVYTTQRCATHDDVLEKDLNDVLLNKECRRRNLSVKSLKENEKLAHLTDEELMARCSFAGKSERVIEFTLPELTPQEKAAERSKLAALSPDKIIIK